MLLLPGELGKQCSPTFLSLMPRSPLEPELEPHSVLGFKNIWE